MFQTRKRVLTNNVKDSLWYTLGNYLFRFSSVLTNLVINNILGVTAAGAITYINALDQNIDLLYSPLRSALERKLPQLRRDNNGASVTFVANVFMLNYILIIVGSVIFGLVYMFSKNELVRTGALLFIGINAVKSLSFLLRIYHKSLLGFKTISFVLIAISLVQPIVMIYLSQVLGYSGFFWGKLIVFILSLILLFVFLTERPIHLKELNLGVIKQIYSLGFPLVLYSILSILILTVDKFFIEEFLGLKELGIYGVSTMLFQTLLLLPVSIYGTYYPKFIAKVGDQRDNIFIISEIVTLILLPVVGFSWFLIEPLLALILPDFLAASDSCKIFMITVLFAGSYQMFYMDLIRKNLIMKVNFLSIMIIAGSLVVYHFTLTTYGTIESVAIVTSIVFILVAICNICLSMMSMGFSIIDVLIYIMKKISILAVLLPLFFMDIFDKFYLNSQWLGFFGFLLLYVPMLLRSLRKGVILKVLFQNE